MEMSQRTRVERQQKLSQPAASRKASVLTQQVQQ